MRLLIIEDEPNLREQLQQYLQQQGYAVDVAEDGQAGFFMGREYPFDLAIVDLGLPKLSGIEVIQKWRAIEKTFPVLILTARGKWQDKVEGLEAGADDYLVKPFHHEELLARTRALLRRSAGVSQPIIQFNSISINTSYQSVFLHDTELELTAYEYKVIEYLVMNSDKVISKTELTEHIYDQDQRNMKFSIHSRILFSALIILILFMSLTGLILEKAFRDNVENAQREYLRTQIYTLLATAEINENNQLQLPEEITEPRLNISESGLHARVMTVDDKVVWQSKSMLNTKISLPSKIKMGEFSFANNTQEENTYALVNFTTIWITDKGELAYVFQVAENKNVLNTQITLFQKNLWGWLAGVSFILIIIQTFILRWGLKPLRHVAEDLNKIEKGEEKKLSGEYPKEITPLTNNLNQLLASSQQQLTRYRDALGNMAHSLKTPIAVLQGIINNSSIKEKNTASEQLKTINTIVEYQLQRASQRASTMGRIQSTEAIALNPIAEKIITTLNKVYKDKQIESQLNIPKELNIKVDKGDLFELLGNLIENAFKWCDIKVTVSAEILGGQIQITIEDDGPGINKEQQDLILLRGQRADQSTPGHGLGLAMVNDMLLLYKGSMKIIWAEQK